MMTSQNKPEKTQYNIVLITKYNIAFEILIKFDIIYKQAKIYFNNPETILSPFSPGKTDRKVRNKGV